MAQALYANIDQTSRVDKKFSYVRSRLYFSHNAHVVGGRLACL